MLLKEALEREMNEMIDNFFKILRQVITGETSLSGSHLRGATPFKVQVKFDIPIFEGKIGVYVIEKWLNLLEGYFLVHNFQIRKRLLLHSSNPTLMSRTGGKPTMRRGTRRNPHYF